MRLLPNPIPQKEGRMEKGTDHGLFVDGEGGGGGTLEQWDAGTGEDLLLCGEELTELPCDERLEVLSLVVAR